jgi:predicted transcriptional regulator
MLEALTKLELELRKTLEDMRKEVFEHPPTTMEELRKRQGVYTATSEIHQKIVRILSGVES